MTERASGAGYPLRRLIAASSPIGRAKFVSFADSAPKGSAQRVDKPSGAAAPLALPMGELSAKLTERVLASPDRMANSVLVKYPSDVKSCPAGMVKFDAVASSEMKFAHIRVSEYFIAKLFHSALAEFHLPARANFTEKSTCFRKCFFHGVDDGSLPRPKNMPPACFYPPFGRAGLSTPTIHQIPYKNRRYPKISPVFMGWMMGVEPTTFRATI